MFVGILADRAYKHRIKAFFLLAQEKKHKKTLFFPERLSKANDRFVLTIYEKSACIFLRNQKGFLINEDTDFVKMSKKDLFVNLFPLKRILWHCHAIPTFVLLVLPEQMHYYKAC